MTHLLLLGAGFSRNWGGWLASEAFEYLIGCSEIIDDGQLRNLLWKHQESGAGFEGALEELQSAYLRDPHNNLRQLTALQSAITRMFADMNRAFLNLIDWEFSADRESKVQVFLARFDAIFTLNQDIFLEKHYCNDNVMLLGARRWSGAYFPGLKRTRSAEPLHHNCLARSTWVPDAAAFRLNAGAQPIFKLHGSSNWTSPEGKPLLIMGGAKAHEIVQNPILRWYSQQFDDYLFRPNTRLMIIGYGFRDPHINASIRVAVDKGLRIFIIAPAGAELAFRLSPTRQRGQIVVPTEEENMLKQAMVGASRRPLAEIFGGGTAEFGKVMRFFRVA
ncbi:MAG: hypothetical protein ACLQCB_22040 [Spirochaetia bacterium]